MYWSESKGKERHTIAMSLKEKPVKIEFNLLFKICLRRWNVLKCVNNVKFTNFFLYNTSTKTPLISLIVKVTNKNTTVFGILQGSKNITFVYILNAEFYNIWK